MKCIKIDIFLFLLSLFLTNSLYVYTKTVYLKYVNEFRKQLSLKEEVLNEKQHLLMRSPPDVRSSKVSILLAVFY